MKRSLLAVFALAICCLATPANARDLIYGELIFDEPALAYSNTSTVVNTGRFDDLSVQAVWSSATIAAVTFSDGRKSSATITVADNNSLVAAPASFNIRVASNSTGALTQAYVDVNGTRFKQGAGGWAIAATATGTAVNIAALIDADANFIAVAVSTVVYATAAVSGTWANSWTVTTSTPAALVASAATMTGGLDNARLGINGVVFDQGTHWTKGANSSATAKAISDALMANSSISSVIISTWSTIAVSSIGVVYATSTTVGVNTYSLFTSTAAALKINGSATVRETTFLNGAATGIDLTNDTITTSSKHNLTTGLPVLLTVTAGSAPTGLVAATTYYAIRDTSQTYPDVTFKLAATSTGAIAGVAKDITAVTGSGTFVLTPLTFAGTPSFKLQISNDNTNWFDLAVASVTYSGASNTLWSLGEPGYQYLRVNYTAGTAGGLNLRIRANGYKN